MNFKNRLTVLFLTTLFTVTLFHSVALGQKSILTPKSLTPKTDKTLSISVNPYMLDGWKSLPVLVTAVKTEIIESDARITLISVHNSSNLIVKEIEFSWYLVPRDNQKTIIAQGKSPFLLIPNGIAANDTERIQYQLTTLLKVQSILAEKDFKFGNYSILVAVSSVRDKDKNTNSLVTDEGETVKSSLLPVSSEEAVAEADFCANQACAPVYDPSDTRPGRPPIGYTCSDGAGQTCTNSGSSCVNKICTIDGGGTKPPIQPIQP